MILEPSGNLWGSERALLDSLADLGDIEVAVCCPPGKSLNPELDRRGIRLFPYYVYALHEKSRRHRLWAAFGLMWACLSFRPQAIYLNQSGANKVALLVASILSIPIVAHVRLYEDIFYLARQRPRSKRLRAIVSVSCAVAAEVAALPELRQIDQFQLYDPYLTSALPSQRLAKPADIDRIACVGRLVPVKGQDVLLGALGLLKSTARAWECAVIGEGDEAFAQRLRDKAAQENIPVRWMGVLYDVPEFLKTCHILAVPSLREPLGRVILEGWAAGSVPVVFAGSGGAAEVVSAAQGGILYEQQGPEALANALRKALDLDEAERSRLVGNGQAWMAKNCDPKSYGKALAKIIKDSTAKGLTAR